MKKLLLTILALVVLSSVLIGCAKQAAPVSGDDVTTSEIDQLTADMDNALNGDLSELDTLDQELAELEMMDFE